MNEVIPFPTHDCSVCSHPATRYIRLYNLDNELGQIIKKYFCHEHLPREAADVGEND